MLRNYIKISLRNLKRQRLYSVISMSSLALGLGIFILFALISSFSSNFDTFHKNAHRTYGVVQVLPAGVEGDMHSAITPAPLAAALSAEFPEIEEATRFHPPGRMIVQHKDKVFYETGVRFVDTNFLSVFSFKMKAGEPEEVLSRPYSIVLTEEVAAKYFGDENPVGNILTLDNKIDVIVTGVTENVPNNSTIVYDFLVSMDTANALYDWMADWKARNQSLYLVLAEGTDPGQLGEKCSAVINKYYPESKDRPERLYLFPLTDIFLKSFGIDCYWANGQISFTFWIIPALLLVVACINFMNLSTARYVTRAKEVGLRKVIGAQRPQLVKQFLGEAVILTFLSLPIAVLLYELLRPFVFRMLGDFIDISLWDNPQIFGLVAGATLLTGIFAGSYPAFFLSVFKPVRILKGNLQFGKKGGLLRKTLVVVQFTFSIILIVTTIVSIKQLNFSFKADLGYDRTNILAVEISGEDHRNLEIMRKQLRHHKDVVSVSASTALPVSWDAKHRILPEGVGEDETLNMNVYGIDYDFIELVRITMAQGRSFSRTYNDSQNYIVNETAVQQLNWENPLGKHLTIGDQSGTVIGVTKDFHFKSIYFEGVSPTILRLDPENLSYMLVRYTSSDKVKGVVEQIRELWKTLSPNLPFEYVILDYYFEELYRTGDQTAEMSALIGGIAIFLSCLGLFGLSSYSVERKKKEIGIRKVLGASVPGIIRMLIKEFMLLILIANFIAIPLAYFLMRSMVMFMFAHPMNIGPSIFLFTAVITLLVGFFTVISLTWKAAFTDPVDSLRYE